MWGYGGCGPNGSYETYGTYRSYETYRGAICLTMITADGPQSYRFVFTISNKYVKRAEMVWLAEREKTAFLLLLNTSASP